jgi:4-diphosphocytidyl-2-C-methyl-D-erythritol kinase
MMRAERSSPCKVNLILNILGKRADGFHELETVFYPVAIYDRLQISRAGRGIQLTCNHPGLPTDRGNLVYRAAENFLAAAGIGDGVEIHLEKNIPLAAGLGGGSANAAVTLTTLNELFGFPLEAGRLASIASELGSDVPFFLQTKPALATGRGEQIKSLELFPAFQGMHIVLVHPGFGVSTAWAYKNLGRFPTALNGERGRAARLVAALEQREIEEAKKEFYNSLEAPVLEKYPLLTIFQEWFRENRAVASMMSGSGSTTFAIVRGASEAEELKQKFKESFGGLCWLESAAL